MAMETIVITDLTEMRQGHVCLAGYRPDNNTCVRPVENGSLNEDWLTLGAGEVMRPFALVELDFIENKPDPPHIEDWIINPEYRKIKGHLDEDNKQALLRRLDDGRVENIFGATVHRFSPQGSAYVVAGEGARSLGTIIAQVVEVRYDPKADGTRDYRLVFIDESEKQYRLAVTDLAFRRFLDHQLAENLQMDIARELTDNLASAHVFLRIGLARRWSLYPDRCTLQITGVYSFPDYLDGRCFADF